LFAPFASAAFAADSRMPYPVKLVTLVTHSSPGSGSDVFLRQLVKYLQRYIAATFIVENDDGGSGAKAVARVAGGRPDGSIFYATTPTYILTSLLSKPARTFRDLDPVVNFFSDAEVVYVRSEAPYRSLSDVIERARKSRARWGVSNPASLERESAEQLKNAARVNAAVISHEGGSQMIINVLNGTLDMGIGEIEEIRPELEGRKVRLLATFNGERMPSFPDLPTVKELGYDVVRVKFRGLAAPKGLPPSIITIWDEAARKILADPEYKKAYEADNLVPLYMPHDRYRPFIASFAAQTAAFLKSTGVIP
jgi:putative tricarboxylic transport membrane protein